MLPSARGVILFFFLVLGNGAIDAVKWPFSPPAPVPQQVKVSFDDENFSFWDPFKNTGFNASATLLPAVNEVRRRTPGYLAYAGLATGLRLFLPPNAMTAVNVAYVVAALARSHEDVETFCKDEGMLLLVSPSVHLALVGSALRVARFRTWRRLFVKATLFRLRYQLLFRRMYRPRWLTKGPSALELIVRDTAAAARSVQGLFPDLCHQAALVAGGCGMRYWSNCTPVPRVEKGWGRYGRLDRSLKREFGKRARRARPGDDGPVGPGLLGWRIPRRIVRGSMRLGRKVLVSPARIAEGLPRKGGKSKGGETTRLTVLEGEDGEEDDVIVEILDEMPEAETNVRGLEAPGAWHTGVPTDGPLIRLHNVTAVASPGSTLTKSYRALAELPFGDGRHHDDGKDVPAWAASGHIENDSSSSVGNGYPPRIPMASRLQPVIVKRTVPRQLLLAADDIASARRTLRRLTFHADLDLDLSGVVAEVTSAVSRAGDLRLEAHSIERVRSNLARAGMLGTAVGVPEVVSCPELGPLARCGLLVTTALRGVDVSDAYVMEHAAARGEKERTRFVDGVFAVFGQMCLADGYFPSNPMPDNLLYMYSGQVGLTDLSSVSELTQDQRRALCRLYRTMVELKHEDAADPSPAAENKARAAMEAIGLVIDLPPIGGVARTSMAPSPSAYLKTGTWTESEAAEAVAAVAESVLDATLGIDTAAAVAVATADEEVDEDEHEERLDEKQTLEEQDQAEEAEEQDENEEEASLGKEERKANEEEEENKEEEEMEEEEEEEEVEVEMEMEVEESKVVKSKESPPTPTPPVVPSPVPRPPLTHVMLLRGLFDTQRDEALALVGGGCGELLRGMAVRRLPRAMVPVLRMVANLRGICAHLDVDQSLLPRFSRAASKGLSWRLALAKSRGGGSDDEIESGTPPRLASAIYKSEPASAIVA